jgi:hypothetical protein
MIGHLPPEPKIKNRILACPGRVNHPTRWTAPVSTFATTLDGVGTDGAKTRGMILRLPRSRLASSAPVRWLRARPRECRRAVFSSFGVPATRAYAPNAPFAARRERPGGHTVPARLPCSCTRPSPALLALFAARVRASLARRKCGGCALHRAKLLPMLDEL